VGHTFVLSQPLKASLTRNSWVMHGDDDSVVYLRQTQALVNLVKHKLPETELRLDIAEGHDHAFDVDSAHWREYAGPAMEFISSNWLQQMHALDTNKSPNGPQQYPYAFFL
jgi:hypothetical protein